MKPRLALTLNPSPKTGRGTCSGPPSPIGRRGWGMRAVRATGLVPASFSLKLTLSAVVSTIALLTLPTVALAQARIHSIENGSVQVRRQDSGVYIYGRSRMPLQPRDALLPSRGARVRVDCSDGSRQPVTAGRLSGVNVICPGLARSLDGRNDDDLLQLLAGQMPYMPQVFGAAPIFTWPDVHPGESYQVTVSQVTFEAIESADPFAPPTTERQETVLHTATAMTNRWIYDGPLLEAEGRYQLQVEIADEVVYQAAFQPLATTTAELVGGVGTLKMLDLEPLDEALALAYLYQEVDLSWAIIELLPPLVLPGEATATGHYLLAESYLKTGSYGLAETHYGAAVTLAEEIEDMRTVAEAWVGLAKVAAAAQNRELTAQRLAKARQIYAGLAVDEGWVATIDHWLNALALHVTMNPGE